MLKVLLAEAPQHSGKVERSEVHRKASKRQFPFALSSRLSLYTPLIAPPCYTPRKDTHAYYFAMNSGKTKAAAALAVGTRHVTRAAVPFA